MNFERFVKLKKTRVSYIIPEFYLLSHHRSLDCRACQELCNPIPSGCSFNCSMQNSVSTPEKTCIVKGIHIFPENTRTVQGKHIVPENTRKVKVKQIAVACKV